MKSVSRSVKFKYISNGLKNLPVKHNKIPQPHSPDELDRRPPDDSKIPYDWALKHR